MAGFGDMGGLMQRAQQMQRDLERVQNELKDKMVEGSAGDGAVTVIASGDQQIMSIRISEELVDPDDVESLEDLLIAACNNALEKSKELQREESGKVTGGISIPGLM
ncbi:MAG: YbaB/EbfC family nucleoid-associated protein [Planctomycetes bacterium]|nr:YbaB/EbfC family nucleoid-associated protein [Planctomycetota bacterium]